MHYALAALAFLMTPALAAEPTVKQLLAAEAQANSQCRDTYNEATTPEACSRRDRLVGRLSQVGWCYGKRGQIQADKEWHPCSANSIRQDDLRP
jgi:hypothetical protein